MPTIVPRVTLRPVVRCGGMADDPEPGPPQGLDLLERYLAWRETSTGLTNSAADQSHQVTPVGGRGD